VLFAVYRLYPLLEGLRLSFTNARLGRPTQQWVGLANYTRLAEDTRFGVSLWNTAFYTVASTLPILAVPLVLALALNRGRLRGLLRSVFFFPFTLSVSSDADAFEMQQPDPTKLTSLIRSPSVKGFGGWVH